LTDTTTPARTFRPAAICWYGNISITFILAFYFFLIPFCLMVYYLNDPALKSEQIPRLAIDLHHSLSPKYAKWAQARIASGQAKDLSINDIAGTEWPVFGSVFYLWATEALQEQWDQGNLPSPAPKVYAADAIKAATALVADPGHASWVQEHWGDDYLHTENVFYRMLVISALTSYEKLIGDKKYISFLRDQVETLSKELDESPYGLLDDYPDQCFPTDVIAAIAAIKRADPVLGTDHSDFINRSIRGFQGKLVDSTGLPPYMANAVTGRIGIARGCSNQWVTVWAPELWPEYSKKLYDNFEEHFWQKRWTAVGFREFTKDEPNGDWYFDVDSGPVLAGHGVAASAFGLGAATVNGRFDHAYPLAAETIVFSWPLPNGTLTTPRFLSNMSHAPYLGEAAILFTLTRNPAEGVEITTGGRLPIITYLILALHLSAGIVLLAEIIVRLKRKKVLQKHIPFEKTQLAMWAILLAIGTLMYINHNGIIGLLFILLAQFFPKGIKHPKGKNSCQRKIELLITR
jgi:hypothetical protein